MRLLPAGSPTSLRRQYAVALAALVGVLVVVAATSVLTVVLAMRSIDDRGASVPPLRLANREVARDFQEAVDAVAGPAPARGKAAGAYAEARSKVLDSLGELRTLAEQQPVVYDAEEAQRRAVKRWLGSYGDAATRVQLGRPFDEQERSARSVRQVRQANRGVDSAVDALAADIDDHTDRIETIELIVVTVVPVIAMLVIAYAVRRFARWAVDPLTDLAAVIARLRAGDDEARASVTGPDEVREIAAGLNLLTEENRRASEVEADVLSQLETIDRVRTDLVSTVSHELRTPLTSIKGYLELLQDDLEGMLSDSQHSMLGVVRRNIDRLDELIANLLALSKAEETQLVVESVDLRGLTSAVATDLRLAAAGRDITMRTVLAPVPVTVAGDRSQLTRALQNLATNAVKFSRPGGEIELRVFADGDEARIEVADEGIGIPAADLPQLGSRFFRASNAMRAEIAGTGLGLRIVQTIVDRHEGALAVESVEGDGATFTIRLPLAPG